MRFLIPLHSSIVIGTLLPPPPELLGDALKLSSSEKSIVSNVLLPPPPAVLSVMLSTLLVSATKISFNNKGDYYF